MDSIRTLLVSLLLFIPLWAGAQRATNVQAHQEGRHIIITYDLDRDATIGLTVRAGRQLLTSSHLSGDVGYVKAGHRRIVWDVLEDYRDFIYSDVTFQVDAVNRYTGLKYFFLGQYGYNRLPQHSGGLMIGVVQKLGFYASVRTNFCFTRGSIVYAPIYTGDTKSCHYVAQGGFVLDMSMGHWDRSMIALYAGVGYGRRYTLWRANNNTWIEQNEDNYSGIAAQTGIIADIRGFTFNIGVSTIAFKYAELEVGVGITIPQQR